MILNLDRPLHRKLLQLLVDYASVIVLPIPDPPKVAVHFIKRPKHKRKPKQLPLPLTPEEEADRQDWLSFVAFLGKCAGQSKTEQ